MINYQNWIIELNKRRLILERASGKDGYDELAIQRELHTISKIYNRLAKHIKREKKAEQEA